MAIPWCDHYTDYTVEPLSSRVQETGRSGWLEILPLSNGKVFVLAGTESQPAWVAQVLKRIEYLTRLPEGWDSYGAKSISPRAAVAALHFLVRELKDESDPPTIVPTVTGGLQLEWHRRGLDLEIEITPEETVLVYGRNSATRREFEGGLNETRRKLATLLSKLT